MPPLRLSSKQCHRLCRRRRRAPLLPGNQRTGVSQAEAVGAQELSRATPCRAQAKPRCAATVAADSSSCSSLKASFRARDLVRKSGQRQQSQLPLKL